MALYQELIFNRVFKTIIEYFNAHILNYCIIIENILVIWLYYYNMRENYICIYI